MVLHGRLWQSGESDASLFEICEYKGLMRQFQTLSRARKADVRSRCPSQSSKIR